MSRKIFAFTVVVLQFSISSICSAATNWSGILQMPFHAEALAQAEAASAVKGADFGGYYNPGGLIVNGSKLSLSYQGGENRSFSFLDYGFKRKFANLGVGFGMYDAGNIELVKLNGEKRIVKAQQDYLGTLTFSRDVLSFHLLGMVSYGVTLKALYSKLVDDFSAAAYALDAGCIFKKPRLSLSVVARNIGSSITYDKAAAPLPMTFVVGWLYEFSESVRMQIDLVKENNYKLAEYIGVVYKIKNVYSFYGGYKAGMDTRPFTFGLGYKNKSININGAIELSDVVGQRYIVSIGKTFE